MKSYMSCKYPRRQFLISRDFVGDLSRCEEKIRQTEAKLNQLYNEQTI